MIAKPTFSIHRPIEETVEFYVNGVQVGEANHDTHGWVGIEETEALFAAIAAQLDVEVEEI